MATMSRMTSYIPTLDQIDELHQKIAPSQAAYDQGDAWLQALRTYLEQEEVFL